jgi:TolB protein
MVTLAGCTDNEPEHKVVPHEYKWGIYSLDLTTEEVELVYGSPDQISQLSLNNTGDTFAFTQQFDGDTNAHEEICTIRVDGSHFRRLTRNGFLDTYPAWSPDGSRLAYLSFPEEDLDIYVMQSDGTDNTKLYDSGSHDADIHWVGDSIAFTAFSRIWVINDDGTRPAQVTEPPRAGQWGNANLPFGDYDPRISPDGQKIVFERLEADDSPHGNYNIFLINVDGSGEVRLTTSGYSQGFASWSRSGDMMVYIVAAVDNEGKYDIYQMNSDGTNNRNITPDYFPEAFLCNTPVFSADDQKVFFVGEWWE